MTIPLIVVGAGGFGREVLDVVEAMNTATVTPVYAVLGVIDSGPSEVNLKRLSNRGYRYLGTEAEWLPTSHREEFVVGVGSPVVRRAIAERFASHGLGAATLIHPSTGIGSASSVGVGSVLCAGVQVSTNVHLGEHVHINANATVGHDSRVAEFASVNPGAIVSGEVIVGAGSLIGAGSVVLQGLVLGAGAIVGAAACVVRDVSRGDTVVGVPARVLIARKN